LAAARGLIELKAYSEAIHSNSIPATMNQNNLPPLPADNDNVPTEVATASVMSYEL
jgi:hypothetical protein